MVPLTSNVARLYSAEAYVRLGRGQRKAMAGSAAFDAGCFRAKFNLYDVFGHPKCSLWG